MNMYRYVSVLVVCIAVSFVPGARAQRAPNALLWQISGNGLTKNSYLFGMMDYVCPGDYSWTKTLKDAFNKCDKVCFSVDPGDEVVVKEVKAVLLDGDRSFKSRFTGREYTAVARYIKDSMHLDIDDSRAQMLTPLALQPSIIKQLLSCGTPISYEKKIMEQAKKMNKLVVGIESGSEFVHEIEDTHFNDKVAQIFVDLAGGSDYYRMYRQNMESAYRRQDLQSMNQSFKETKFFSKADIHVFLDEKNERWVSRMPAMMLEGSVFFGANPTNMWGEEGLINQLRKKGYTVTAVLP